MWNISTYVLIQWCNHCSACRRKFTTFVYFNLWLTTLSTWSECAVGLSLLCLFFTCYYALPKNLPYFAFQFYLHPLYWWGGAVAAPQTGLTSCQIGGIGHLRTVPGNPRRIPVCILYFRFGRGCDTVNWWIALPASTSIVFRSFTAVAPVL